MSLILERKLQFKGSDGHVYSVEHFKFYDVPGYHVMVDDAPQLPALYGDADAAWAHVFNSCKDRKVKLVPVTRAICVIAREVARNWVASGKGRVYFGAVPYLDAMRSLERITDSFGYDSAREVVTYFLANAQTYRGGLAKAHKLELNALVK
jgi:hypothetical protein